MIGEYMNIPFINDMYEEKNICVNEFSSEFQSLIDTYIVKNDVNRDDLLIVLIAAFLGRYNFAQSRFLVELIPNCGERLIFNKDSKEICGDLSKIVNLVHEYYSVPEIESSLSEQVLVRFVDEKNIDIYPEEMFDGIVIELNANSIIPTMRLVASNNSFRLSEMYMEFEKYAMSTLKNERIIIDKSIILSISSSLDKYYFEEEIKRGLGCYNYSVMLDDGHKSNNEIGDALHVIVYSLWDIADNSKTAKENSIAFDLYNEKFLVKKEQVNLAIIVSDLKNINFSKEIQEQIDIYKDMFVEKCKTFCNSVLDFSGYSNTDIYNLMLYQIANIPYKKEFYRIITKEVIWSYLNYKKNSFKLIVLDGDETLWDGIISDDGIENIKVGNEKKVFQERLKDLKTQGILLAISSRNNIVDIEKLFDRNTQMILQKDDFLEIIANFDSKSNNIIYLSQKYSVGLNNILFIDDSFFECGEVMKKLPEVTALLYSKEYDFGYVLQSIFPVHNTLFTIEDSLRMTTTKKQEIQIGSHELSKEDFWRELDAHYLFSYPRTDDYARIVQLNSRVNRYRLSLDELKYDTITSRAESRNSFVVRVNDKFGDYGIVAYIAWKIENSTAVIDNWIMSCRLSVEYAEYVIWNFLLEHLKNEEINKVCLRFEDTGKNARFLNFCSAMNLIDDKGYCLCDVDCICSLYQNVPVDCKIGEYKHAKQNLNVTLNFENRMQIFDYRVTQELQDVIDSTNSRNTWLFLSNRGIQSSYSENSAVYASLDLLHDDRLKIVQLWEMVLNCKIEDFSKSFISYGGNSILYMELMALIMNYWDIDFTKVPFKLDDSVLQHEKLVDEYKNTKENAMVKFDEEKFEIPKISERFFTYNKEALALHIPVVIRIPNSDLDRSMVEEKLYSILSPYRVFRSIYLFEKTKVFVTICSDITIEINEHEYKGILPKKEYFDNLVRPFDLNNAPLINFDLIHCDGTDLLMIDYCHVIVDGLSVKKISQYISDVLQGASDVLNINEKSFDYYDYWYNFQTQYSQNCFEQDINYWIGELKGISLFEEFPVYKNSEESNLPFRLILDDDMSDKVKSICKNNEMTEFIFFLSIYAMFLHAFIAQKDITIGVPFSCKHSIDSDNDFGQYVNTLVFRSSNIDKNQNIKSYVKRCNDKFIEDISHGKVMFQDVVNACQKEYGCNKLFDTIFVYENDIKSNFVEYYQNSYKSMFDMNIIRNNERIAIQINYDPSLVTYAATQVIGNLFCEYACDIINNFDSYSKTDILPLLCKDKYAKCGFKRENGAGTIIDEFLSSVKRYPNKMCFSFQDEEYTYSEINQITNYWSKCIVSRIGSEQKKVLVICDDMRLTAISILSVMKSGNIYIPVSQLSPDERIKEIISTCNIEMYISRQKKEYITLPYMTCDISAEYMDDEDVNNSESGKNAYIIYTSGTTGKSKGVLINHKGLLNTILSRNDVLGFTNCDTSILLMGAASDGFMTSFFSPLISGAKICFPNNIFDIKDIVYIIENKGIRTFLCTPTMFNTILNFSKHDLLKQVRLVALAGESVSESLFEKGKKLYPALQIANEYGPTENSICTSINPNITTDYPINAGNLINNVNGIIVNKMGIDCPEYVIGELLLSGIGLAVGYVGDENYNREKFVEIAGERWYRTGDLAFWGKGDVINIVGRVDNQVKINGYRVDLTEIKNELLNYPEIESCEVVFNNDTKVLTAYYIAPQNIRKDEIMLFLGKKLNRYMIPLRYLRVSEIPKTEIGKTDAKLLNKYIVETVDDEVVIADDKIALQLTEVFIKIIGSDSIGNNSDFFEIGGNSIGCIVLLESIEEMFNVKLDIEDIRLNPTPLLLANIIVHDNNIKRQEKEFKPFNSFWFIDCFYTSLVSIIKYYDKPISPFIESFNIVDIKKNGEYKHVYNLSESIESVLWKLGIKYNTGILDCEVEQQILDLIELKRPVIMHVDCFYLPYCNKYYTKEHCDHVLTIIDYDSEKKSFCVVDQKNLDSVSFSLLTIDESLLYSSVKSAMMNRKTFFDVDYVFLTEEGDLHCEECERVASQYNNIIDLTIQYVEESDNELGIVIERLLNYILVEKKIAHYRDRMEFYHKLEKNEILLKRLLMRFINEKRSDDKKLDMIETLEKMI